MRTASALILLALAVGMTPAADPPAKKDEPKLKIGDPAPPLSVSKWHQGPEVKEFEKDKVYVVVFWGAFLGESGPILRDIDALRAKHKGVIPVAVGNGTEKDKGGYSFDREAKFLADAKPKFGFGFANEQDGVTKKAYGSTGIDHAVYVVGKDGKIAYTARGQESTLYLSEVLPKVLDGSWKGQKDADAIAETEKEFQKAMTYTAKVKETSAEIRKLDPSKQGEALAKIATESLKTLDDFLKTHPSFAGQSRTLAYRARVGVMSGQKETATKTVEAVIADGVARSSAKEMTELATGIGTWHMEGQLGPDVAADKLMAAIIDAAMKFDPASVGMSNYQYLMTASMMVGTPEKGRALIDKMFEGAPADIPADKVEEAKKMLVAQFEEQAKQIAEELKKRKK
jgi:hypothetical protein